MRAFFAGSFDPFTTGHAYLIEQLLAMGFDSVNVHVAVNADKPGLLPFQARVAGLRAQYCHEPRVVITSGRGLTAQMAKSAQAILVRGVRNAADFTYEQTLAEINRSLFGVSTILLPTTPHLAHVSSSLVRELLYYKQPIDAFVPEGFLVGAEEYLQESFSVVTLKPTGGQHVP